MQNRKEQPSLFLVIALTCLFSWAAWKSWALQNAFPFIPYVLTFFALAGIFKTLSLSIAQFYNFLIRRDALAQSEGKGSAAWATKKEIKQAGLHDTKGVFLGCDLNGHPIFFEGECHGLSLAPAGSGKTVAFSVPALCHSPLPMIVSDFKGTLAVMTKALREKQHKQDVFCVNPAHLYTDKLGIPARYNPEQILIDD